MRHITLLLALALAAAAFAAGLPVSVPEAAQVGGVACVPLAPFAEVTGMTVSAKGSALTVKKGSVPVLTFACTIGKTAATANGKKITLPLAPFTCAGAAWVPLRPLLAAVGAKLAVNTGDVTELVVSGFGAPLSVYMTQSVRKPSQLREDGEDELYELDLDTGAVRRLTYDAQSLFAITASPDGKWFTFISTHALALRPVNSPVTLWLPVNEKDESWESCFLPGGTRLLYAGFYDARVLDFASGDIVTLDFRVDSVSPDGKWITAPRETTNGYELVLLPLPEKMDDIAKLTPDSPDARVFATVKGTVTTFWQPDSRRLWYDDADFSADTPTETFYTCAIDPDGTPGAARQVEMDSDIRTYSHDGRWMFFWVHDFTRNTATLMRCNADGSGRMPVTLALPMESLLATTTADINADDTKIAYACNGVIYLANADGTRAKKFPLPHITLDTSRLLFTPDQHHLLFGALPGK